MLQAAITLLVSCRLFYDGRRGIGYIREILKPMTEEKRAEIMAANKAMADKALRVLAAAKRDWAEKPADNTPEFLEQELVFLGLTGMIDPVRPEVKAAIEECRSAGIRPVMITGDHKDTAVAIAKELGIITDASEAITGAELAEIPDDQICEFVKNYGVYARVQPEHKTRIVTAWKANDAITAMTGDGVNDAPSIKSADIGVGMGITGTDVTKNVADMVLADDNFATIVDAVREGRGIYANIKKVVGFLLGTNIGEVITVFVAMLLCQVSPLLSVQLLWINLVTDSLPALALAYDPAEKGIMKKKPMKNTKAIFTKGMTWRILYQGVMIGLLTLTAFILGLATTNVAMEGLTLAETKIEVGQTMAFITLALSELVHVFNVRNPKESVFKSNPFNCNLIIILFILYLLYHHKKYNLISI